jgi:signal transduction histidine kinase
MKRSFFHYWRRDCCFLLASVLAYADGAVQTTGAAAEATSPADLTTAEQVHSLTREDAARGHRAVIRGVVTSSLPRSGAAVVQDQTRGIYIDRLNELPDATPPMGELVEIEGVTDPGEFAPQLHATRLTRLGPGQLPTPVQPTWDQLINGSLDTQFVEIQGVVTAVPADGLTLLTHGGKIKVLLIGTNAMTWTRCENALIRLRGCLFASWDPATHQVRVGEIRMFSPALLVEEPAPEDLFTVVPKHARELLLFDPQASALRRVKVFGQVVHQREGEYFMMDGPDGVRFFPKVGQYFEAGDLVEVVGFPVLTGPAPVLREVIGRKIGTAPLPNANPLRAEDLFRAEHDATRVSIEGLVLGLSADRRTLEMQTGLRRFVARLASSQLPDKPPAVGSRIEIAGVYAGHGGNRTTGAESGSFELLVNAPGDIRVLALPPFWTLRRLLVVVGALIGVLAVALVWIRLLHHQVRERTTQLQQEIREREQAEQQRALAQERARIARDLHDDLGSSLTEITMLASTGPGSAVSTEELAERLETIAGRSRTMVHALDEIVWAVDPERDTLASVGRYLASYAEEYLSGLKVACRVQIPNSFPEQVVSGEVRHNLFLAVKEALNNAVSHGQPAEVTFRVSVSGDCLQISISDNGTGFDLNGRSNGHGLLNLRSRLQDLRGQCELTSSPGLGTTVSLHFPLLRNSASWP